MARADIESLLGNINTPDTAPKASEVAEIALGTVTPMPAREGQASKKPAEKPKRGSGAKKAVTPQRAAAKREEAVNTDDVPLYLTFERKIVRLRADQYEELIVNSRRLNKAKGTGGVRITENTLARVAFDLLISRMDELHGATEEELRRSLGLPG
ncbi:hypothetical protein [Microbacterium sp. 77mftsu3.1]|uniref:hypothetical protein n=1 Tax=Microbacterium sp. 77mftsu3.1 TaxID=1761802 RepID=UPI000374ADA9|nr:hypothetical protein [Microbacterium sp. 77mftsu3.1]SDH31849.1 hypothetical protein SAMN04488590_3013 [Microbacterium sp. 77mftsu3.1]